MRKGLCEVKLRDVDSSRNHFHSHLCSIPILNPQLVWPPPYCGFRQEPFHTSRTLPEKVYHVSNYSLLPEYLGTQVPRYPGTLAEKVQEVKLLFATHPLFPIIAVHATCSMFRSSSFRNQNYLVDEAILKLNLAVKMITFS